MQNIKDNEKTLIDIREYEFTFYLLRFYDQSLFHILHNRNYLFHKGILKDYEIL